MSYENIITSVSDPRGVDKQQYDLFMKILFDSKWEYSYTQGFDVGSHLTPILIITVDKLNFGIYYFNDDQATLRISPEHINIWTMAYVAMFNTDINKVKEKIKKELPEDIKMQMADDMLKHNFTIYRDFIA